MSVSRADIGRRVIHPNWNGRERRGVLRGVANRYHADVQFDGWPYPVRALVEALEAEKPRPATFPQARAPNPAPAAPEGVQRWTPGPGEDWPEEAV